MNATQSHTSANPPAAVRPAILIVEDELILAKDLQRTLIDFGYDAFAIASSAEAAVRRAEERCPDLVMMDIRIKGRLDGIETATVLKEQFSPAIIYLTAHSDTATLDRAKATEPHGYLLKPASAVELRTTVELALHRHQLDQARAEKTALQRQHQAAVLEMGRTVRENNETFRLMIEGVKDHAIFMLDTGGRVTSWNVGAERLIGYCEQEIVGQPFSTFYSPDDVANLKPERVLQTATGLGKAADQGWRIRKDGAQFFADIAISAVHDPLGQLRGFAVITQDITRRKHTEALLSHQAAHDSLTDLPNRGLFSDRLSQAMAAAVRRRTSLALLYLDLDRFKQINDSFGHLTGDRLLQTVAQRLTQCIRASDTVSRQGGDEFVILLTDVDAEGAAICADKVLQSLRAPYELNDQEVRVSASMGIAIFPQDGEEAETLLQNADSAMYEAKSYGRNNSQFYRKHFNENATVRRELESELYHAIERRQLEVVYQPIVDLKSSAVTGVEALLRWRHPTEGLLMPARFMGIAEESGLIVPLGRWMLYAACAQAKAWESAGLPRMRMGVNVSSVELCSTKYDAVVAAVLEETRLDADLLVLELTETFIMQDSRRTELVLNSLKDIGARLALDDFGTGYSSLSYIRRFPVDIVKIDRSFIRDLGSDDADASIVSAVIKLGNELQMGVIAEGVETPQQLSFLKAHHCAEAQGYLFSRPLEPDQITALLRTGIAPPQCA